MIGHEAVALAFVTDLDGRMLVARNADGGGPWLMPGGAITADESPRATCCRRLAGELSAVVRAGELLVTGWQPAQVVPESAVLAYVFDCGISHEPNGPRRRVASDGGDARQFRWMELSTAMTTLPPFQAQLLLAARSGTRYLECVPQPEMSTP